MMYKHYTSLFYNPKSKEQFQGPLPLKTKYWTEPKNVYSMDKSVSSHKIFGTAENSSVHSSKQAGSLY